jgi:hypothetical protein
MQRYEKGKLFKALQTLYFIPIQKNLHVFYYITK